MIELEGALGKADVSNRMLDTLERELESIFDAGEADAFILYVYGLVLADRCEPVRTCR
jgi:anaphase-promoting complex subunit 8